MIWNLHPIQDLIILERLDRIVRREQRRELARGKICPKCGRRIFYSVADVVYLHEDNSYFCPSEREESS